MFGRGFGLVMLSSPTEGGKRWSGSRRLRQRGRGDQERFVLCSLFGLCTALCTTVRAFCSQGQLTVFFGQKPSPLKTRLFSGP
jgi:hypothetical protein